MHFRPDCADAPMEPWLSCLSWTCPWHVISVIMKWILDYRMWSGNWLLQSVACCWSICCEQIDQIFSGNTSRVKGSLTIYDLDKDEVGVENSERLLFWIILWFLPAVLNLPSNPIKNLTHINYYTEELIIHSCDWPAAPSGQIRILWHHRKWWCRTPRFPFPHPNTVRQAGRQTIGDRGQLGCLRAPLTVWLCLMYPSTRQQ